MQHFQLQLKNLPAFDIFDKLFQIALNYKLKNGEPSHRTSDPIKVKNISLLLAWPGILVLELATLTGRGNYKKQLTSLRNYESHCILRLLSVIFLEGLIVFYNSPYQ